MRSSVRSLGKPFLGCISHVLHGHISSARMSQAITRLVDAPFELGAELAVASVAKEHGVDPADLSARLDRLIAVLPNAMEAGVKAGDLAR